MKDDFLGLTQGLTKTSFLESNHFNILGKEEINGKTVIKANSESIENISIVFNEDQVIESIETISTIISLKDLKEAFTLIRNSLRKDYDSCNTFPEDYIKKEPEDLSQISENGCFYCKWNKESNPDFSNKIEYIFLKAEKVEDGFICKTNCKFMNETNEQQEDLITDEVSEDDLLDDEETVYENDDGNNLSQGNEEVAPIQETVNNVPDSDVPPENLKSKQNNTSISKEDFWKYEGRYLLCMGVFVVLWIFFLADPIGRMLKDFSAKSIPNLIYYIVYFAYTVLSCILPIKIAKEFLIFKNTANHDRQYLIDDSIELTPETHTIWKAYKSTFFDKNFGIKDKTRASADLYFNYESVIGTMNKHPIISWFRLMGSSFLGLGILGTFIGFSIGLSTIDFRTESTTKMMEGIEALVKNGLATAFNTSIVGVMFSLFYNFLIFNPLTKKIKGYFEHLSDGLDKEFYVSETEALMQYTMVTGENSENITFSQSLRFIVENMNKQTDALNNFNDNLADKIANMKQSVDTAMERIATDVGGELKNVVVENVHKEMGSLKTSLADAAKEFSIAAEKLTDTPAMIEKANNELKTYLEETRTSFSEMLAENERSNKTILDEVVTTVKEQLADQFREFSKSLVKALNSAQKASEMLADTPDKIDRIETALIEKESEVAVKFDNAASKLTDITTGVKDYLTTMQNGIASVLQDLSNAEENVKELLASAKMHEDNSGRNLTSVIEETNRMLEGFKSVDINLKSIFESIGNEIVKYNTTVGSTLDQYLESFEKGSTSFSNSVTGSMQDFESAIDSLSNNMLDVQKTSNQFGESILKLGEILNTNKETKDKDK